MTTVPEPETSALKMNYAEDQLLPRMTDARGHARNIKAPGGWIARTDPDGKSFHYILLATETIMISLSTKMEKCLLMIQTWSGIVELLGIVQQEFIM